MNILIICNPHSGKGKSEMFANQIADSIKKTNEHNAEIFLSQTIESMQNYFCDLAKNQPNKFDGIVFLGGDGTFGIGADALIKAGLDLPVAIFPLGTVNDFAKQIGMKQNVKKCVDVILNGKIKLCDVANVNGDYVVNVACGGYFTHGANTYSRTAKKMFGKMAYYGKAVFNIFDLKPQVLRFTVDDKVVEANTVMYLVLNSKSAGGFKKIGAEAKMDDGYFDLCAIKKTNLFSLLGTACKILRGKHTKDKNIVYLKGRHFTIEIASDKVNPKFVKSDMDGNVGPELPLHIDVVKQKLKIFCKE